MTIGEKFKGFSGDLQMGAKNATHSLAHKVLRLVSGFFIGLVVSLVIQEFTQSGIFMLLFLTLMFTAAIYKGLSRLTMVHILIFDLICYLIGQILTMYIKMAP